MGAIEQNVVLLLGKELFRGGFNLKKSKKFTLLLDY